jgi:hypothetical protein
MYNFAKNFHNTSGITHLKIHTQNSRSYFRKFSLLLLLLFVKELTQNFKINAGMFSYVFVFVVYVPFQTTKR